ncbi:hypothetical protein [Novosphingobium sp.]|uniref:hypothetical protein n=1 Tax=Novosphingobium sp. TaxID=1874826 RepID=UPI001ED09BBE|nr:hypothetical protein [Novosphingobium sp.]MBK6802961.1 hypothetical protein [Novosphingobium sp.]MBK9012189.1 hypothetical protein [Novosphingobium sp.]
MRHPFPIAACTVLMFAAAPALADKPVEVATQPPVFRAVIDCKALPDPQARLACYDKAVGALAAAAETRDVLVVDRATARSTKRSLFGLALPRIKLFGDNDDEEVEQIESTITTAYDAKDGMSVFVLADGARWKQTEGRFTYPKAGQPIVIRRAALGSFFAKVNNQAAVRVIRLPQGQ